MQLGVAQSHGLMDSGRITDPTKMEAPSEKDKQSGSGVDHGGQWSAVTLAPVSPVTAVNRNYS